jgi:hypothetical protein
MASVLAIIGSAGAVTRLAVNSGIWMYEFVDGQLSVNDDIRALHDELRHLQQNADGLKSLLEMPELEAIQDERLWSDASQTLVSCEQALKRFEAKVRKLKPSSRGKWTPKDIYRELNREFRHGGLVNARAELQSHNLALAGVQGKLSIYVAIRGPGLFADEIISRLLPRLLTKLDIVSDRIARMESSRKVEVGAIDKPEYLSNLLDVQIRETDNIISRARTVVKSWSALAISICY